MMSEKISELEEYEVMGRKEGQDECDFLHVGSMSMDSLIENYKDYKERYEKADLKYRTLEADDKLNGNAVYDYHFNQEIYEYLKDEIVRRTIDSYNMSKNTELNKNKDISEDIPAVGRSR